MIRTLLLCLAILPAQVYAWGVPATATTTVEARITNWTENPCQFGKKFVEACEYAKRHNLFPEDDQSDESFTFHYEPQPDPAVTTIVTDHGSFRTEATITNYE